MEKSMIEADSERFFERRRVRVFREERIERRRVWREWG